MPAAPQPEHAAGRWAMRLALFVLLAVALQAVSLGDVNRHADESFYFLVGQRMHDGAVPYVTIWDRKPPGLFALYWLIAGVSHAVLAYQLAACLFAGLTAWVVARIAARLAGSDQAGCGAAGWAGALYLLAVVPFEGASGQAPDFYNLLIVGAVWLVLTDRQVGGGQSAGWRSFAAMALAGAAIMIKQTALFEAVFLGLWVLWRIWRNGAGGAALLRTGLLCALIGAAPTLLFAAWYWQAGYWAEFWYAMVTSNLAKAPHEGKGVRALGTALKALPVLLPALWVLARGKWPGETRSFMALWLLAALIGYLSVPNFYPHYALPLMVPLAVLAGVWLAQAPCRGLWLALLALGNAAFWGNLTDPSWRRQSNESMGRLAAAITALDSGGRPLLVYDGPVYLYALTGKAPMSPLTFPHHLSHAIEANVSHLDTVAEVERMLAAGPGVVVMARYPRNWPVNVATRGRVLAYARQRCAVRQTIDLIEAGQRYPMVVFGRCRGMSGETNGGRSKD